VAGTADPVVPVRMAAQALPACGIDWLRDGGHLLPLEAPDWCAMRIAGFLTRHGMAPAAVAGDRTCAATHATGEAARRSRQPRSGGIGARFGAAAGGYDRHAGVQREVASRLAARIARLDLPDRPRILEIGCGTGLFTRMLGEHFPEAEWTITDVSPAMLEQARRSLRLGGVSRYQVMDGENPRPEGGPGGFDLICSSMALQWFEDPALGLARLATFLAPAGHLAVALPVDGTFSEWRRAHETVGLRPRMIRFPRPEDLAHWRAGAWRRGSTWSALSMSVAARWPFCADSKGWARQPPGRRPDPCPRRPCAVSAPNSIVPADAVLI